MAPVRPRLRLWYDLQRREVSFPPATKPPTGTLLLDAYQSLKDVVGLEVWRVRSYDAAVRERELVRSAEDRWIRTHMTLLRRLDGRIEQLLAEEQIRIWNGHAPEHFFPDDAEDDIYFPDRLAASTTY